jgi:hypothetical protein
MAELSAAVREAAQLLLSHAGGDCGAALLAVRAVSDEGDHKAAGAAASAAASAVIDTESDDVVPSTSKRKRCAILHESIANH